MTEKLSGDLSRDRTGGDWPCSLHADLHSSVRELRVLKNLLRNMFKLPFKQEERVRTPDRYSGMIPVYYDLTTVFFCSYHDLNQFWSSQTPPYIEVNVTSSTEMICSTPLPRTNCSIDIKDDGEHQATIIFSGLRERFRCEQCKQKNRDNCARSYSRENCLAETR